MKTPQSIRLLFPILCMLSSVLIAPSCQPEIHRNLSEKREIWLNQSLLQDSSELLSRLWGTRVELESEVARMTDLSVDYAPGREVSLENALDEILGYVAKQHREQLKWLVDGDRILISK
jgi:hypothetical protein